MNRIAGTSTLLRLAMRRERTIAPWWVLLLVAMSLVMVSYIQRSMGSDPAQIAEYTQVINRNNFFRALGGGFAVPELGYMAAWRSGGFLYLLTAIAAIMAVVRYTRGDEEAGRTELVRAGGAARPAPLTVGLVVGGGVSLAGGALTALTLIAIGLDPVGSLAYGAAITAAGWVFGALAAVTAQLAQSARRARTIALWVLGAGYVLRYAGDATGLRWMTYVSPVGWSHNVRPYYAENWAMLGVPLAVSAVLVAVAYRLVATRDLGAGAIAERPGPATATGLDGPVSLSWRLHRSLLTRWAGAIVFFGIGAGGASTLAYQLTQLPAATADNYTQMFGGAPDQDVLAYGLWAILLIFGYLIALYPVLMVQRLYAEERSGRGEIVHATPLGRSRWAAGHLLVTGLGTAALLALAGLAFGGTYGLLVGDLPADLLRVLAGALSLIPAAWLVGAVCWFAYGLLPRACVAISWAAWAVVAIAGRVVSPLYGVWGGSPFEPFHYIPNTVAGAPFDPVPALVMLALTALLLGTGLTALRRRDFG